MKSTRDDNGIPICPFCDAAVTALGIVFFFATVGLAIAAIWGFDVRWMWTSLLLTGVMVVLSAGKS